MTERTAEELRKAKDSLEIKVRERTLELEKTVELLKNEVSERKKAERLLKNLADVSNTTGMEYFRSIVSFIAAEIGTEYTFIGILDTERHMVRTIAVYAHGEIIDNIEYSLQDTPCDNVMGNGACFHPDRIQELFPDDTLLVDIKVKSYGGIPLFRSDGEPLGIIVALGCKPMKPADKERIISLLQIFSSRVSSELERKKSEKTIKNSEANLRIQKTALEKKNISFKELIKHIDEEKNKLKEDITININRTLMPVIAELEKSEDPIKYIGLLKLHLEDMQSAFGRRITDGNYNLTAREVEISNLIKGGARSKDICNLLNISYETVEKHRKNIRKKLGISNKKVNLFYFLQKMQ